MTAWSQMLEIILLLAAALLLGIAAQRLRANAILGYLLAGILLGPQVLGLVTSIEAVQVLAELGVALLLFSIGLEFSFTRLKTLGRVAFLGGSLQIVLTAVVAGSLAWLLGIEWIPSLVTGAAVALSSTAVVLRLLAARTELDSGYGRNSLGILLFQDLAIVPLMILVSAIGGGPDADPMTLFTRQIGSAVLLLTVFFVVIRLVLPRLMFAAASGHNRDFPVMLAAIVSVGCTWSAHAVGLSPALGAFSAGLLLADFPYAEQIRADVMAFRTLFVTLFFSSIGMLAVVPNQKGLLLSLGLAAGIMVLKFLVVVTVILLLRQPPDTAIRTGIALAQIGEFSFVLLQAAVAGGVLAMDVFQLLLTASVVTLFLSPYLMELGPRAAVAARRMSWLGPPSLGAEGAAERKSGHVVLVGFGPAGSTVAAYLIQQGVGCLVIETNAKTVIEKKSGVVMMLGDATQPEILEHAHVASAAALVVTVPDPAVAEAVIRQGRLLAPKVPIISRARYHLYAERLATSGARVVDEEELVGHELARVILRRVAPEAEEPAEI